MRVCSQQSCWVLGLKGSGLYRAGGDDLISSWENKMRLRSEMRCRPVDQDQVMGIWWRDETRRLSRSYKTVVQGGVTRSRISVHVWDETSKTQHFVIVLFVKLGSFYNDLWLHDVSVMIVMAIWQCTQIRWYLTEYRITRREYCQNKKHSITTFITYTPRLQYHLATCKGIRGIS